MYLLSKLALAVVASLLWQRTHAGSAAYVNACVQLDTTPETRYEVKFTAGSGDVACMNSKGHDNTTIVSKEGLACASLGYVELKASSSGGDTCSSDHSYWGTKYYIAETGQGGSTESQWYNGGEIELQHSSPGTVVCPTKELCSSTTAEWNGVATIYIIYKPGQSSPPSPPFEQQEQDQYVMGQEMDL